MFAQQFQEEMWTEHNTVPDHKIDKGKKRFAGLHMLHQEQSCKTRWKLQDLRDILWKTSIFNVSGFQTVNLQ